MTTDSDAIVALERRFWDALVAQDAQTAIDLLAATAVMVNSRGALSFGHEQYRQMAEQGPMILKSYEFDDVQVTFPTDAVAIITYRVRQEVAARGTSKGAIQQMIDSSTWVRQGSDWKCVMHTEAHANDC